ncbi:MAG: Outer membrane efflux protein [Deltaproteobacteria bacterium CSP1-8]|nr:MAG: Outer membrane efflux protein [Deltaproteobacteria bacterium CSP1-8]
MSSEKTVAREKGVTALFAALVLAWVLAAVPVAAGEGKGPEILTLPDALRITYEKNRDIGKAREYRNLVEGRYVEERAAALPQVTVSAFASRNHDESQKAFGGDFIPVEQDNRGVEAGVSQALFTWGQVGAAIRAAKIGLATADDQLRLFRQAAARDVTAAFYDILLAKELSGIATQNLEQKLRHLDEARRKFAAGTATDYDVLAAEVAVENARPEVIRTENLVRLSRERLRFLLGRDGREVDVSGTLVAPVTPYPSFEESLPVALRNRPDLSDLRHRTGVAGELVKIASAGDKPRLDLKAGYGWRELDAGHSDADGKVWTAGLFVTYPVFDGLRTRGKVAQAKSDERTLRIGEAKLLDSIALEVRGAIDAVQESGEIVKALSGTVAQAERLVTMAEKGFEFGVKTRLDVDDAQINLTQAKGNLARARRDYLVAQVTLRYVMGTLGESG